MMIAEFLTSMNRALRSGGCINCKPFVHLRNVNTETTMDYKHLSCIWYASIVSHLSQQTSWEENNVRN